MTTLNNRITTLETIADPPALRPLHIKCCHWTEPIDDTPVRGGPMVVYHRCPKCLAGKGKDTKIKLEF